MNSKWYISTLISVLTFLGIVVSQQNNSVPNQEIVLQFTSDEVSSFDTQHAISSVKEQLQAIGILNIQVKEQKGQLKITYYSEATISSIKEILSNDESLNLRYSSSEQNEEPFNSPNKNNKYSYNLDIYEIQSGYDFDSNTVGKFAVELKVANEHFKNPNVYFFIKDLDLKEIHQIVKSDFKFFKSLEIAIDNISYKIPEVRAGPAMKGNFI